MQNLFLKKIKYYFFISLFSFGCFYSSVAQSVVRVDIAGGHVEPMPIAVLKFQDNGQESNVGEEITTVIVNNLQGSGLFKVLDSQIYPEKMIGDANKKPNFSGWNAIDAHALVNGFAEMQADGRIRVGFRLWDIVSETSITGLAFYTEPQNWRRVSHIISDHIYKALTGHDGYFDTRILYVSETGTSSKQTKRLAIMDQDGANHRFLTDGRKYVSTPRFSSNYQDITYLEFTGSKPQIYLMNINSGQKRSIGKFDGITFAPRFSPDGRKLVMSVAKNGNTDLFIYNLQAGKLRRLTRDFSIETAASFSPDGKRIAFESDRGGQQQIYVMGVNGGGATRISFGEGSYATPVWSPKGDYIAFTRIYKGRFFIGIMKPDGSSEKLLAESYHVEGPSWAPNGRVLMYFSRSPSDPKGRYSSRLYSIDITGFNEREVITPGNASDPSWSPKLP